MRCCGSKLNWLIFSVFHVFNSSLDNATCCEENEEGCAEEEDDEVMDESVVFVKDSTVKNDISEEELELEDSLFSQGKNGSINLAHRLHFVRARLLQNLPISSSLE
mmetsp:Transcript_48754/g.146907  ORF Transcript_48754/g.146907 Transcript_48754/m.146907 type:complete len:106 (+) Transcript_48754:650-967(+)